MLTLHTLGGLSLKDETRPVSGAAAQRRPLALLAAIASAGERGISRDRLQAIFWPDSDTERARGALKQALYALRRDVLQQDLILGTSDLRLNAELIGSDVGNFERELARGNLETAVAAYDGPFLDGVHLKDQLEFERWVERERERLAEAHRAALQKLAQVSAAEGNLGRSAEWWKRLVATDPVSSRFALSYMKALVASGDREGAIRHGRAHADLVRSELELEPDLEVTAFAEKLRQDNRRAAVTTNNTPSAKSLGSFEGSATAGAESARVVSSEFSELTDAEASSHRKLVSARRFAYLAVGIVALAIAGGAYALARTRFGSQRATLPGRVLVARFDNRTGARELDALGSMTAEWITDGLSRSGFVSVVDPETAMYAMRDVRQTGEGSPVSSKELSAATGASVVIRGVIFENKDSLEFIARVINATDETVMGSIDPVRVAFTDQVTGVSLVRQRIMGLLARQFDRPFQELVDTLASPPLFEAYHEYLRGVDMIARGASADAVAPLRRAYHLDTTFLTPLVWAVHAYHNSKQESQALELLDSLNRRRDRLTPLDRSGVDAMRADARGDMAQAIAAGKAAAALAPRSQWSWNTALFLVAANRPREALLYLERLTPGRGWMTGEWPGEYWDLSADLRHRIGDYAGEWRALEHRLGEKDVIHTAARVRGFATQRKIPELRAAIRDIIGSGDPRAPGMMHASIMELQLHGLPAEAQWAFEQAEEWFRTKANTHSEWDQRNYARMLLDVGRLEDAKKEFKALSRKYPRSIRNATHDGCIALITAMQGDTTTAIALAKKIPIPNDPDYPGEDNYWRARVFAELGRRDAAVEELRAALGKGLTQKDLFLEHTHEVGFPKLRGFAPFEDLVKADR